MRATDPVELEGATRSCSRGTAVDRRRLGGRLVVGEVDVHRGSARWGAGKRWQRRRAGRRGVLILMGQMRAFERRAMTARGTMGRDQEMPPGLSRSMRASLLTKPCQSAKILADRPPEWSLEPPQVLRVYASQGAVLGSETGERGVAGLSTTTEGEEGRPGWEKTRRSTGVTGGGRAAPLPTERRTGPAPSV